MPRAELVHQLLDHRAAESPDRPAVTHADVGLSYRELREASLRLATWLRRSGVAPGDRVLIGLRPSAAVVALVYAASRAGAAFCILHEQVAGAALEHVLDDAEPSLFLTDDPAAAELAAVRGVQVSGSSETAEISGGGPVEPGPEPEPGDLACLIYTSGSTSKPKAVVSTQRQMVFAANAIHSELRYRSDDVVYSPLPLAFDYGLYQLFLGALGGSHVRLDSSSGSATLLRGLIRTGATVLPAMPTIAESLAWLLARRRGEPPPLRLLTSTGAAMPPRTLAALRAAIPGLGVQLMYGLTECKRVSIMPLDGDLHRPGSSGRPLTGTEVLVVDADGAPLPPGEVGELLVRGPHVMAGYWRRDDLTRRTFTALDEQSSELRTGDYGSTDAEGYLYLEGRRDDVYKERGFRLSTTEIEAAALEVDGVRSAAVLPPDPGVDRPHAVLVIAGELTSEVVVKELRTRIEPFKVPRSCVVVESIPLTNNRKVDKKELGRMLSERAARAGATG
jgi:acyl-CoA synthetase (AMP-forming)/AMP-acid ligase II